MPDTHAALSFGRISVEPADVIVRAGRDGRIGTQQEVEADLLPVAEVETVTAVVTWTSAGGELVTHPRPPT